LISINLDPLPADQPGTVTRCPEPSNHVWQTECNHGGNQVQLGGEMLKNEQFDGLLLSAPLSSGRKNLGKFIAPLSRECMVAFRGST
jgi:hypothetical protein